MENSSVKVEGLLRVQANVLAILCETGEIATIINAELERTDIQGETISNTYAYVEFDESEYDVDHVVNYNQ